jgi:hypothetical protein
MGKILKDSFYGKWHKGYALGQIWKKKFSKISRKMP